ncbi:MAG: AAA family ATPase [Patescibacteria group bacterium]
MFIKRIEICGFKSFAEKTVLNFKENKNDKNNITAIVGPNGSGKSNISDAIRWVLGEQSMKYLRGKKSEDIIFAGSESKAKMSMASVVMFLDNSDKKIDIDFSEVVITRRLYRTGESEYLLNGSKIRLFDLQLLLAKAQFGQDSYSLIGQGTIDRLLLQSSAERKDFFDEAVGIKEFQIKRHHSDLKLKKTKENIHQAEAILAEIEPRLKSLKKQVSKLEKRQELESELKSFQENYYYSIHSDLKEKITDLSDELEDIEKGYVFANEKLLNIQNELADLAKEKSRQELFQELQIKYAEAQNKKNNLEKEKAIIIGKLQTEYSKVGKQNIAWLENKINEIKEQGNQIKLKIEKESIQKKQKIAEKNILVSKIESLEKEKINSLNLKAGLEKKISEIKQGKDEFQFEGLRSVSAILKEPKNSFNGNIYGVVAQLATVDEKYRLALEIAAQANLASIVVENDNVAQNCINFLKRNQLGYATFLPLNTIKARVLSQNIEEFLDRDGVYGLATDLADYDKKYENIFSYVFGSTLIIDSMEVARKIGIGKIRMVSLDGDIFETSGSIKGGFRKKSRGILSFSAAGKDYNEYMLDNYEQEAVESNEKIIFIEKTIFENKEKLQAILTEENILSQRQEMLLAQSNEIFLELSKLEQELSMCSISKEDYGELMKKFEQEKEQITKVIILAEKDLENIIKKQDELNQEEENKRKRIFSLQDEMQKAQSELNSISENRHALHVQKTKLEAHEEDLSQEIYDELKISVQLLYEKQAELKKIGLTEIENFKSEIEKIKYKLTLIGGIDEEILGEYDEIKNRYENLNDELKDLNKASTDLEKMISELDKLMKKKHNEAFKKIKKEFARYFEILFEGGKADLIEVYGSENETENETESDSLLNEQNNGNEENLEENKELRKKRILTGIDVLACPPGKKIKNIAALSGGERTLTSIALLCAILHTNPAPFVLLDEVEAALDEANTLRFTKILEELAEKTQFIIITHNRVSMHSADRLYGVTMGNDGVSKLVSVDLEK